MAYTYSKIATYTVGSGGIANVSFLNIPQTYTDLVLKMSTRDNYTGAYTRPITVQFNGLSTSFSEKFLYGDGASAASFTSTSGYIGYDSTATATASTFANGELYIPNYTSGTYKSMSTDNVSESNIGTGPIASLAAGLWSNTSPINSISIVAYSGFLFAQYSTFHLYGVKAEV